MQESIENYQKVYRMLEDRESKDTYMDRLAYLISDDYKYIEHIITVYLPDMLPLSEKIRGLLRKLPPNQKIVLYGAGGGGARILQQQYSQAETRLSGISCDESGRIAPSQKYFRSCICAKRKKRDYAVAA